MMQIHLSKVSGFQLWVPNHDRLEQCNFRSLLITSAWVSFHVPFVRMGLVNKFCHHLVYNWYLQFHLNVITRCIPHAAAVHNRVLLHPLQALPAIGVTSIWQQPSLYVPAIACFAKVSLRSAFCRSPSWLLKTNKEMTSSIPQNARMITSTQVRCVLAATNHWAPMISSNLLSRIPRVSKTRWSLLFKECSPNTRRSLVLLATKRCVLESWSRWMMIAALFDSFSSKLSPRQIPKENIREIWDEKTLSWNKSWRN